MTPVALRVLVVSPLGPGGRGGIDRIMDALGTELTKQHSDAVVDFATSRGGGDLLMSPLHLFATVAKLLTRRYDLVHVNVAQGGSVVRKGIVCLVARACGVPYLVHLHGSRFDIFWRSMAPWMRWFTRMTFRRAKRVIVLGTPWRDLLIDESIACADRILTVPNAAAFLPAGDAKSGEGVRILFLGRLGERKGTPQLLQALASLQTGREWSAVLAGDGDVDIARRYVASAGLEKHIQVPGWVGAETATALLTRSDILVLPSLAENLPMSVIEGMAAGLAIVTTPVGAIQDIIVDGETGLLVAPGDALGLSSAIARLIENDALRAKLGANAREFHRRHLEISSYAKRMLGIWRDAAASPTTR